MSNTNELGTISFFRLFFKEKIRIKCMNKQITDKKISNVIWEVANLFSVKSKETILFENYGKPLHELKQIVLHYNRNTKILDVGVGLGFNLICLKKLFMDSIDCHGQSLAFYCLKMK